MTAHVIAALALVAFGILGAWERPWRWARDRWRARNDRAVDRHPVAQRVRALRAMYEEER